MALVKASHKQLKAVLASEVRKLGLTLLVANSSEFPLFTGFLDLDYFWLSDLKVFAFIDFDPLSLLTSPTILVASILAPSISLAVSTYNNMVVFIIDVSYATILLNPWINRQ